MATTTHITEANAIVLAWPNDKKEEQRQITWTDVDAEGLVVIRTVTLLFKNSQCKVEIEEWDGYAPDLLRRGTGDILFKSL